MMMSTDGDGDVDVDDDALLLATNATLVAVLHEHHMTMCSVLTAAVDILVAEEELLMPLRASPERVEIIRRQLPRPSPWQDRALFAHRARYRKYYRMDHEVFYHLVHIVSEHPIFRLRETRRKFARCEAPFIETELHVALLLRTLAGADLLDLAIGFRLGESTIAQANERTIDAILEAPSLNQQFPLHARHVDDDVIALRRAKHYFRTRLSPPYDQVFAGCIGALDGICIRVEQSLRSRTSGHDITRVLSNRKAFPSLNAQAVAVENRKLAYVDPSFYGKTNDNVAWALTPLSTEVVTPRFFYERNHYAALRESDDFFFIVADSIYRRQPGLLTRNDPVVGADGRRMFDLFGRLQSTVRVEIECAFGLWHKRWGMFWRPLRCDVHNVGRWVITSMLINNFIIDQTHDILSVSSVPYPAHEDVYPDAVSHRGEISRDDVQSEPLLSRHVAGPPERLPPHSATVQQKIDQTRWLREDLTQYVERIQRSEGAARQLQRRD